MRFSPLFVEDENNVAAMKSTLWKNKVKKLLSIFKGIKYFILIKKENIGIKIIMLVHYIGTTKYSMLRLRLKTLKHQKLYKFEELGKRR